MSIFLEVQNLQKNYGNKTVIKNCNFTLPEYTSTALIGPNGAGKTTILSMLTGLLKPSNGTIKLQGETQDLRKVMGFLPQYPQFDNWLTAREVLVILAALNGLSKKDAQYRADEIVDFVGLTNAKNERIGSFSGGMRQRLGIAQAIIHKPKLLLLDEPVSALDPVGRRQILTLLKQLQQEMTILYATHILNDAEEMTDQILFLQDGVIKESGTLNAVRARYAEPKILIYFTASNSATRFMAQTTLHAQQQHEKIIITEAHVMPIVMQELLPFANEVLKITRQEISLEAIFMKVAQQ